ADRRGQLEDFRVEHHTAIPPRRSVWRNGGEHRRPHRPRRCGQVQSRLANDHGEVLKSSFATESTESRTNRPPLALGGPVKIPDRGATHLGSRGGGGKGLKSERRLPNQPRGSGQKSRQIRVGDIHGEGERDLSPHGTAQ